MSMSRRERWLMLLVAGLVTIMVADRWILGPLWESYQADCTEADRAEAELTEARQLARRKPLLEERWNEALAGGANLTPAQAEQNLAGALQDWAKRSGLTLTGTLPQRDMLVWDERKEKRLGVVSYRVTAVGSYASVTKFLELLERDAIPIRLDSFELLVPDEKKDELRLNTVVSQVCQPEAKEGKS